MPEKEGKLAPEKPWQPVKWGKNKLQGIGYEIEPVKRGNKRAKWAFILILPVEAKSFSVGYEDSKYGPHRRHTDKFIVKYSVAGGTEQRVMMVPLTFGDRRIDQDHFSVRLSNVSSGRI